MKKKKIFLIYLKNVLIFNLFFLTTNICFSFDFENQLISQEFRDLSKKILLLKNDKNLKIELFDINNKIYKSFIESSSQSKTNDFFAIYYFDSFLINKEKKSFCLIYYDSKSNILSNYQLNFSKIETFKYLFLHEISHCIAFNNKINFDENKNELIADMISLAYLYFIDKDENLILKILNSNSSLSDNDIHYNYDKLLNFYNKFKNINTINDINSILKLVLENIEYP